MKKEVIVGIDEAGRGPIAGPLSVAMVRINPKERKLLKGIRDSKKLSQKRREEWFKRIQALKKEGRLDFKQTFISSKEIDKKGLTWAINKGIKRVLSKVHSNTSIFLDGGIKAPIRFRRQKTIIGGDNLIDVISTASIVAKVLRDKEMVKLSKKYPEYNFEKHKGYGTNEHYRAIKKYGLTKIHRESFLKKLHKTIF